MPKFEPTRHNFREAMLFFFHFKKSAAGCHRLLVEEYGNYTRTIQTVEDWFRRLKSGDFDHPWIQGNAMHMGGPKGCSLLRIAKNGRNHHRRTLPNSPDKIERCGRENTAGIRGKAQPNYSSTRQRSTPNCESSENLP